MENKQQETIRRLKVYNNSGADGIFLPCIAREDDIAEGVKHCELPLNVMALPGLSNLAKLNDLGVKRVSMGPFMFQEVYASISTLTKALRDSEDMTPIVG